MTSSARPTLVMLPGLEGSGAFFAPFTQAAAGKIDCKIIAYPDTPPMGYDALEKLVLPQLPQRNYFLLAESFAGPLGVAIARRDPYLQGLILTATFVRNPLHKSLIPVARAAIRTIGKVTPPDMVTRMLLLDPRSEYLLEKTRHRIIELDEETLIARCTAALGVDRSADLAALTKPVLILAARHDRLIHKSAAQEMKALARNCMFVEIDAPHFLLQSAPNEALAVIYDFITA